VRDYLASAKGGGFHGWPYSYFGRHLDPRVHPRRPDLVEKTIVPDYALSSPVAPLRVPSIPAPIRPFVSFAREGAPTSSPAACGGKGDCAVAVPTGEHAPTANRAERRQRCQQKVAKRLAILALFARVGMAASCDSGDCAPGAL